MVCLSCDAVYITNFHKYLFHTDTSKSSQLTLEKSVFNIINEQRFSVKTHSEETTTTKRFDSGTIKLHYHASDLPEAIRLLLLKSSLILKKSKSTV